MGVASGGEQPELGLRERKRRETLQRITDAGISLFIQQGFDRTTLDEIATAAGISRRTFFYYFKSKDEILLSLQRGVGEMFAEAVRAAPATRRPIDVIRRAIVEVCAPLPEADMLAIDKLMRSNEAVQARKQASYIEQERMLFEALRERWPEPERATSLRLVVMMAVGAMRLSFETFHREEGKRPVTTLLNENFDALEGALS